MVLTGEKKHEAKKDEKGWHVMERSFGAFRRAIDLPFEPAADAVEANFENGVLYLSVKKPAALKQQQKSIEIKAGAPKAQITQGPTGETSGKQGGKAA
jgi:HSP20 family protein